MRVEKDVERHRLREQQLVRLEMSRHTLAHPTGDVDMVVRRVRAPHLEAHLHVAEVLWVHADATMRRQELLELGGGRGLGLATPQTPTATTLSVMGTGTPMQQLNMNPLRTLTSGTLSVTPHYVAVSSQRYVDRHGGDRGRVVDEPRSAADKHVAVAREQSGCVLELQEQRETDLCVKRTNKPHRTLHGLPATVLHAQCQRRGVNGLRLL
jgi:hypothetical protein